MHVGTDRCLQVGMLWQHMTAKAAGLRWPRSMSTMICEHRLRGAGNTQLGIMHCHVTLLCGVECVGDMSM
eukprot:1145568-Pelagomonas_calceolata.AAC.4